MSESVIPAVLLRALSEYKFVCHPLWRMADGKDHVRVELTFHKNLPTLPVYKRRAESRRQPAPSAGEWPRQPTAARRQPFTTRSTPTACRETTAPDSTPRNDSTGEGDFTASSTDTGDQHTRHHHSYKTTKDSTAHAISIHQETSYTGSFSRDFTCQETENEVAEVHDQTADTVLPCQHREQISSTREIRPPGRPRHHLQGHH